ncbi:DNA starvation/stationary phase protection protein Dps [Halorussus rarus]|uniref:DNA starvation/stationary phase protection protein Dps n=1 Tax=Halorussus TaxID=1070314 RepID=UPI000E212CF4|nr:DNA starvation/stationary phase protection protein Dps [Halorussus rarus]
MSTQRRPPTGQRQERGQSQQGSQQGQSARQSGASRGNARRPPRTYRTAVGLPDETRRAVVGMLDQSLADTTDLMTQAKFAHWNVKGMNFYQLHLLFDEVAETLEEHADIIAERTTALGGEASGTVRMAAANSRIPEIPADAVTGPEYVAALVERVGVHANNLRREIERAVEEGDEDTADLYTELSREVDKQLYFLQSHLQTVEPERIPESPGASIRGQQSQGGAPSQYRPQSQGQQAQGQQPQNRRAQAGQEQYHQQPRGQQSQNQQAQTGQQSQQRRYGPPRR